MQDKDRIERITELIERYKAGDDDAFVELYMETREDMERFLRARLSDLGDEQVNDILQISFIRIANNLKGFKKPEKYMSWAFEIVKNTGLNYIRDEKKYVHAGADEKENASMLRNMTDESADVDPYRQAYAMEVRSAIICELNNMDPGMKETFCLYYFDQLKMEEIAEVQGISIGTVKSRLSNGRRKLREKLAVYRIDKGK